MIPSAAARISSKCASASARSIFAMMKGCLADFCRSRAHSLDVRGAFNERLAHRVNAFFKRKLKTGAVVFGKRADAQINAGKVQSFA